MTTQAAVSGNATKNNGGVVKKGGNTDTVNGPITAVRTLLQDAQRTPYGAKVILSSSTAAGSSGNLGTANAFTNFAYQMVEGRYIMKKNTSFVNGSANTFLTSCARESAAGHKAIPLLETTRALGSGYLTSWDYETGAITKGANAGAASSFGADHAARPSNATPGELVYKYGSPTPTDWQDDYKPKTNP